MTTDNDWREMMRNPEERKRIVEAMLDEMARGPRASVYVQPIEIRMRPPMDIIEICGPTGLVLARTEVPAGSVIHSVAVHVDDIECRWIDWKHPLDPNFRFDACDPPKYSVAELDFVPGGDG